MSSSASSSTSSSSTSSSSSSSSAPSPAPSYAALPPVALSRPLPAHADADVAALLRDKLAADADLRSFGGELHALLRSAAPAAAPGPTLTLLPTPPSSADAAAAALRLDERNKALEQEAFRLMGLEAELLQRLGLPLNSTTPARMVR